MFKKLINGWRLQATSLEDFEILSITSVKARRVGISDINGADGDSPQSGIRERNPIEISKVRVMG